MNCVGRLLCLIVVGLVIASNVANAAESGACNAETGRAAWAMTGEIGGAQTYREDLGNGWTFALLPAPFGWELRVFDAEGADLTAFTPPLRFAPNPREIFGWHFRNADNSATNDGSVNAPQHLRSFIVAPDLVRSGVDFSSVDTTDPAVLENLGRGSLTVLDYGLADLEPGQRARMIYLRFHVCLTWRDDQSASAPPAAITPEDIEIFGACGLNQPYALEAYVSPPILQGDFDGDGSFDHAGAIIRLADGKRAIAICRAGTWLHLIGIEGDLGELTPEYFDDMDYWVVNPKGPLQESYFASGPVPIPSGDTITIGIEGASSVALYWNGNEFRSYWQGD